MVLEDVRNGFVSAEEAMTLYGLADAAEPVTT
jgi:hypothetical protein